jgi:predicted nucleic acid-binding protein
MEMKYIIDTSAYSSFFKGEPRVKRYFEQSSSIYMPVVVAGELRAGFAAGNKRDYNEGYLQQFLDQPKVRVLNLSDKTTFHYASIYAALKQAGTPIGSNDMWIAALALEHDCLLVTLDSDFKRVPNLRVAAIKES